MMMMMMMMRMMMMMMRMMMMMMMIMNGFCGVVWLIEGSRLALHQAATIANLRHAVKKGY